jgi:hypothetical protein
MAEYKIKEEDKKVILKKHLLKTLPILIIAIIFGMVISFFQINDTNLFLKIIIPVILLAGLSLFVGLKFGLKLYKENHVNIIYKIENNIFTILKNGKDFITVDKEKINKIEQYKDKSIIIFLKDKNKIMLNDKIENYDNLIEEIKNINQILFVENKKPSNLHIISAVLMLALMAAFYISPNRLIMISSGLIICIILLISFIRIIFNKYVDKKIKLCMIAVFFVIYEIIQKILLVL